MAVRDVVSDIKTKLETGVYCNEEHIRLNLVARLLQELGWDIWDPEEVYAEWAVAPSEDRTKVDLALFLPGKLTAAYVETKPPRMLSGGDLRAVETQVRDYSRDHTAMFSVITDGDENTGDANRITVVRSVA